MDTQAQQFTIPPDKVATFAALRKRMIAMRHIPLRTLQRFQGKACSFILCVPAAKLFCREVNRAIATGKNVTSYPELREELALWRFLDNFSGWKPWRSERHVQLHIATDSSGYSWGAHFGSATLRDYWSEEIMPLPIHIKEGLAVVRTLEALAHLVKGAIVDLSTDNQAFLKSWENEGGKDRALTEVVKELFVLTSYLGCDLNLLYVASKDNPADEPSRVLKASDASLSPGLWDLVQNTFGPHTWDLMALDSNAACDKYGAPLPHFTPSLHPTHLE